MSASRAARLLIINQEILLGHPLFQWIAGSICRESSVNIVLLVQSNLRDPNLHDTGTIFVPVS